MGAEILELESKGRVRWLTINRPDARNALSAEVLHALGAQLAAAEADASVGAIVLTGAGEKAFSAGGALALPDADGGFLGGHDGRRLYGQTLLKLQNCSKPVIACVNGWALAGGLGLVLGCDLAIASDDARFGLPEIDVGLFPYQVIAVLVRHVGRKQALELCLTGRKFGAVEAKALGIINRVVPMATLRADAQTFAEELAAKSPAVLKLGKRAFYAAEDVAIGPAMEGLAANLSINSMMEDASEGIAAFFEKRPAQWKGR